MRWLACLLLSLQAFSTTAGLVEDGRCPLVTMLPFSAVSERPASTLYAHLATTIMAIEHFNERSTQVIPNLEDYIPNECTVQFPLPNNISGNQAAAAVSFFADDRDKADAATRAMLDYYLERMRYVGNTTGSDIPSPCAVVGSLTNAPAEAAAAMAAASETPYVTHAADISRIGRPPMHPLSTRITVDEYARGNALINYLAKYRRRDYVYAIYNIPVEDSVKVMDRAAKQYGISFRSVAVSPPFGPDATGPNSVYDAMHLIKESGFKTIVVAVSRVFVWEHIYLEARNFGLTSENGYVWLSYDSTDLEAWTSKGMEPGSDADMVLRGAGTVRVLDGFQWNPNDRFLLAWRAQDNNFRDMVNSLHPIKKPGRSFYQPTDADYFQNNDPPVSSFVSYLYDAIMAIGIGACHVQDVQRNNSSRHLQKTLLRQSDNELFNAIVASEFDGASGHIKLNDGMWYTRDPDTLAFGAYNLRPSSTILNTTTGARRYEYILTSVKLPGENWRPVEGEHYIFADGTSNEPFPLRNVHENNYLSRGVRITGFVMMGISLSIGATTLIWIYFHRSTGVIKAAQPEFLGLVCVGSIVTSFSILTLSFDENQGWSQSWLDRACMATPWLFVIGYVLAYSALFSKLWRLERVLQTKRVRVDVWQAMGPLVVLVAASMATLTVWTVVDPFHWERTTVNEMTGETMGVCHSDHLLAFVVPLVGEMVVVTLLAGIYAWRCKDVSMDFSEVKWIFYAIFAQLQVWIIGIPIVALVALDLSTDVLYMGSVLMIWSFSVTIVSLVVGPRVFQLHFQDRETDRVRSRVVRSHQVSVSGLAATRDLSDMRSSGSKTRRSEELRPVFVSETSYPGAHYEEEPSEHRASISDDEA